MLSHHTVLMLAGMLITMIAPWPASATPAVKVPTASLLLGSV
jgi:hypothetical protein